MSKFTKGDWFNALDGFVYSQDGSDCKNVAKVNTESSFATKEDMANGFLIASAPGMYDMLNHLTSMSSEDAKLYIENSTDIVDLLAKARGE